MSLSAKFAAIAKKKSSAPVGAGKKNAKLASSAAASKGKRANVVQAKRTGKAALPTAQAAKAGKAKAAAKAKAAPKKKVKVALKGKTEAPAKADAKKKKKAEKAKKAKKAPPADKGELDMEIESYMKKA